jgi:hypothetical protein
MRPWLTANGIDGGDRRWWYLKGNKRDQERRKLVFRGRELFAAHEVDPSLSLAELVKGMKSE